MATDLSKMSRKVLEKLQSDVEKALKDISKNEMKEARKAAEKAAAKFGFSLDDITSGAPKSQRKKQAVAKYANPDDKSQTWTGRGRQPQWFKDAIAAGVAPEQMAI